MAAIAGAAPPPCPLVVAGAPAVVPGAVWQHEFHVRFQGGDHVFKNRLIVCCQRIKRERRKRLFDVITEINRMTSFARDSFQGMSLAEQDPIRSEVVEARMRHLPRAVEEV